MTSESRLVTISATTPIPTRTSKPFLKPNLQTYIALTHLGDTYLPESISPIVEPASGHFIYASTVIRFIRSPQHRPDDRLQVILGLKQPYEKERPYALLDSLYRLIFLEVQDRDQLEMIYRALGIMHLRSLKSGLLGSMKWTSDRHAVETLCFILDPETSVCYSTVCYR